ncbi:MAG TPA: hypothetical protein VIP77_19330 [Jiangellaceae bacterium]
MVYRTRRLPAVDEVFGRSNRWTATGTISEFLVPGPHHAPILEEIDYETAELIIQETRAITGATAL